MSISKLPYIFSIVTGAGIGALLRSELFNIISKVSLISNATLLVNILGSFFIGLLFVLFNNINNQYLQLMLMTGLLGSFTTFSAFSLDVVKMISNGDIIQSMLYVLLQVILGVSFCYLGIKVAKYFL